MMKMNEVTPILRMFDVEQTIDFYTRFLGFQVDWEHRFEADFPLYMQISRDHCVLHLSEHYGDACPGSAIRIAIDGIEWYHQQLLAHNYKYARPGLETAPWGTREIRVTDPSGNRITFYEKKQ